MNSEASAKKRNGARGIGIKLQVLLGFVVFILITVILLWVFQIFMLNSFYRWIKLSEVERISTRVASELDSDDILDTVTGIVRETGVNVLISDENGAVVLKVENMRSELFSWLSSSDLAELFFSTRANGNSFVEPPVQEMHLGRGKNINSLLLHLSAPQTQSGNNRLIIISTEIVPVNSTVDTLKIQLVCLTIVMMLIGVALSLFIASKISRPIVKINEGAKELARGQYDIVFEEQGSRETKELAGTLNYAAGELSKVEVLRRELIANVSHDLRTPLTMIKGYAEVMRDLPGENTPENIQIIVDETERLSNLVSDLLDISRLEAGAMKLEISRFNLTKSIREMMHRYDKLIEYRFPFEYDKEVEVEADELKISQVIYNLVNNAITYIGKDNTVTLRQTVSDGKVRISVSDTGDGIEPDKLKDIWQRYYKVDKEHRRAQVGTGLGLSIVKNILDLHGGSYGVESELGHGSTFWFELKIVSE